MTLASLKDKQYVNLITKGRVTNKPHVVELWFDFKDGDIYLSTVGSPDWFENLKKDPSTEIEIQNKTFTGFATLIGDTKRIEAVIDAFYDKYGEEAVEMYGKREEQALRKIIRISQQPPTKPGVSKTP